MAIYVGVGGQAKAVKAGSNVYSCSMFILNTTISSVLYADNIVNPVTVTDIGVRVPPALTNIAMSIYVGPFFTNNYYNTLSDFMNSNERQKYSYLRVPVTGILSIGSPYVEQIWYPHSAYFTSNTIMRLGVVSTSLGDSSIYTYGINVNNVINGQWACSIIN